MPELLPGLHSVASYHDSPSGRIRSEWTRTTNSVQYHINVPPNTTAILALSLPTIGKTEIFESGVPAENAPGVHRLPNADGRACFEVGSGDYVFTVR